MNVYVQVYQQPLAKWLPEIFTNVLAWWKANARLEFPFYFPILLPPATIHHAPSILQTNASSMPDAENPAGEAATHTTLPIKNNNKTELVRLQEIIWLQSGNSYVEIQTTRKKYVLYRSLRSIEQELDAQQFVRIHRSAIVNRNYILSISQLPGGDGFVELTTGETIRYSRNYKKELIDWSWSVEKLIVPTYLVD